MLDAATRGLQNWARHKEQIIPFGFSWIFIVSVDATMVAIGAVATAQRPLAEWPMCLAAMAVAFTPWLLFFIFDISTMEGFAIGTAWTAGTAILLFATSTPIPGDFAPLLLSLTVGVVTALTSLRGGAIAAAAATAILVVAAVQHRLDTPLLYFAFIGMGVLIGQLMRFQQELLTKQHQAQAQLAAHAVADERRRIAREVHDVIAHTLSITLLHLTAARHALQDDGQDELAVVALQQAESSGRQAMTDIRHTVGLLDDDSGSRAPEPCISDIPTLTAEFVRAGLNVTFQTSGDVSRVSAAAGLAMYRVAQESLANIAKHAPSSPTTIGLVVTATRAELYVVNHLSSTHEATASTPGRGIRGMRQRIELLGGTIDVGPSPEGWSVRATVPVERPETRWPMPACAS
ncbi:MULTISPECIES: sensor histidine kinase [unclassified Mycobacterium]|uniref:sensor histidine kinase n=1 Tax=unclassified Mycobacterium TaxID=2642494 RepID=UPI0029C9A60A|nr:MULTISPECIES: histidine kinase [unclassified Mycobacterium]